MAERHRLPRLQMGKAGHDGRGMLLGAIEQHRLQRLDPGERLVNAAAHEQFEIRRHLVVA